MTSRAVAALMGGEKILGRSVRSEIELEECVRNGLPLDVIDAMLKQAVIEPRELYEWVIPRRTLAHRSRNKQRLSLDESNRVSRVAWIYAIALDTFADASRAHRWMRKALRQFGDRSPMDMLQTEVGAHQVEALLGRIAHGIAA